MANEVTHLQWMSSLDSVYCSHMIGCTFKYVFVLLSLVPLHQYFGTVEGYPSMSQSRLQSRWIPTQSDPSLKLPDEVLMMIFIESLPPHKFIAPSSTKPPLVLSTICRHCRSIALSDQALWSSLDISDFKFSPGIIMAMNNFLKQSGNHPLRIKFSTAGCDNNAFVLCS
jgi:hypothetical protein